MKKIVFIFSIVLGMSLASISSCQSVTDSQEDEITQMEQVIKKQPIGKKRSNYFYQFRNRKSVTYYIMMPDNLKVERVNEDIAEMNADYDVKLIRVRHITEAEKIIK